MIEFDQKEIYDLLLPLRIIVPQIDCWDLCDVRLYEAATTHKFNNIAYYINTNEEKDHLDCWCENCGLKLFKNIKRYELKKFVENVISDKLTFDNYWVLDKYCENIVMNRALDVS